VNLRVGMAKFSRVKATQTDQKCLVRTYLGYANSISRLEKLH